MQTRAHSYEEGSHGTPVDRRRPGSPITGRPTVWIDEEDQSIVVQGWKITDAATISEITATRPIPGHETVVRLPARMAPFLLVLWNHFAGDGSWVGEERCDDPAVARLCAGSFEAAWERAVPHKAYQPA
jgi:hypothetical protein